MNGNDERPVIIIQPDMSPITIAEYARKHATTVAAVRSQVHRKTIPVIRLGEASTIYINQAAMIIGSLKAAGWDVEVPQDVYSI
ncbi:hypothetical protein [Photobacterium carnosum]|uniref:hypothetical protein n=1 Tax=Photobacterium carnosum TaxID=2023717 RepID=UPI001E3684C2|nr:hypothetical protein [Photobacterium carnosum]MCD9497592.1 hypothetical protein [Photobacterium carnosum]MCD9525135.1 hypothetical protein [Photobacterium carnosum]